MLSLVSYNLQGHHNYKYINYMYSKYLMYVHYLEFCK